MKKKIIFMIINMNVGGTEKALLNMISEIPKEEYDITILMLEKIGGFLDYIPGHVNVEYLQGYEKIKRILNQPLHLIALNFLKAGKLIKAFTMIFFYFSTKILKERSLLFNYILKKTPKLETEYDIAVAYAGPMDFISYFVIYKIKAKKKFQWIHFDVTKIGFNQKFAYKKYKSFNKIFVVSNEAKNKFVNKLPHLKKKVTTFANLIPQNSIIEMSNQGSGFEDDFNGVRILTVGRLSKEKGQDLAIHALELLKQNGFKVRWYCIGEGEARKDYEKQIKDYGLEKDFILLGSTPNPYPFMKQCDIYVQTSRHEGYCITLAEAKCLNKPIITTNFTGAKEQITHEKTGIIVNGNELEIYREILRLINNKKDIERLTQNLAEEKDQNGIKVSVNL